MTIKQRIARWIIRRMGGIPVDEIPKPHRGGYCHGLSDGIARGKKIITDRFEQIGSISAHHHYSGFDATGKGILSPEAKKKIAESLRRKAEQIESP